ncbi:MAG TPA: AMP-binding protein [Candidatus Xenobia bacterium]|jgi:long-chain acyl-CoA synthetase
MASRPWHSLYDPGVPADVPDTGAGLYEVLSGVVRRFPDTPAISYFGRDISYWRLKTLCDGFATALYRRDMGPGKRVAVILPNCPQFVIAMLGALRAGAGVLPLPPDLGAEDVARIVQALPVHLAVVLDTQVDALRQVLPDVPLVVSSVRDYLPPPLKLLYPRATVESAAPRTDEPDLRFQALIKRSRPINFQLNNTPPEGVLLMDDAPPAAAFTSQALATNSHQLAWWAGRMLKRGRDRILSALPLHRAEGLVGGMGLALVSACTLILTSRVRSEDIMPALTTCQPDVLAAPARLFEELVVRGTPLPPRRPITRSLRWALSTGGPLSPAIRSAFEEAADARLVEALVGIESGYSHATPLLRTDSDEGFGLPLPGVDCRIVDDRLEVTGPQISAFQVPGGRTPVDGWVATVPGVRMDADGRFFANCLPSIEKR